MRAQFALLFGVFAMAPALNAQQPGAVPLLSVKTATKVPLPWSEPATPIGGVSCDRDGNVYARLLTANASKERSGVFRLPIQEITPQGTLARTFRITDISSAD